MRGYGVRDVRTSEPVDEHTVFQIGSCTKPLTATALAMLVQDGRLKWDEPIQRYWPGFRVHDATASGQATLRDLLSHRTGAGKDEAALYYEMPITRAELLARLPEVPQVAPFRTEWRYSNLMYTAAGQLLEEVAGETWDEFMARRVFAPLGMSRSSTSIRALSATENLAVPHLRVDGRTHPTEFADRDNIGPAASVNSSARDLAQWLRLILNDGVLDGRRILEASLVRELSRPQILMPAADPVFGEHLFNAYGLGLIVSDYHGRRLVKHAGMAGNSLAVVGFVPEEHVGVVVLTNHRRNLFHYAIMRRVLDVFTGLPPVDLDTANRKLLEDHLARAAEARRRRVDAREPGTRPSLPLGAYAGTYEWAYGRRVEIRRESDHLVLRFGNLTADLSHWHRDTFLATLRQRRLSGEQEWFVTFTVDDGAIAKVHIDSEHDVQADFRRVGVVGSGPRTEQTPRTPCRPE